MSWAECQKEHSCSDLEQWEEEKEKEKEKEKEEEDGLPVLTPLPPAATTHLFAHPPPR